MNDNHPIYDNNFKFLQIIVLYIFLHPPVLHLQMQLLSNKTDKDDTNVITVTKKIGELQFEDEEEDSFFTKVIFLSIFNPGTS